MRFYIYNTIQYDGFKHKIDIANKCMNDLICGDKCGIVWRKIYCENSYHHLSIIQYFIFARRSVLKQMDSGLSQKGEYIIIILCFITYMPILNIVLYLILLAAILIIMLMIYKVIRNHDELYF